MSSLTNYRQHAKNNSGGYIVNSTFLSKIILRFRKSIVKEGYYFQKGIKGSIFECQELLNRYDNIIKPEDKKLLEEFIKISSASFLGRRITMIRYRIFCHSKLSIIKFMLFI